MGELYRVQTDRAPAAIGPYSQAVKAGELLYCSGQIGIDPSTGELVSGGLEPQTRRALENLTEVLKEGGSSTDRVVKTTVYLTAMADFPTVNAIYAEFFSDHQPARATVAVSELPKGALFEIDAIALTTA